MNIQQNFSLQPYNTFGIDVQAQNFATITTDTDLFTLLKRRHFEQQNKLILGGGSNLLFTKNVEGWVLYNQLRGIELLDEDNNWGYSCLTLIDSETIGILYESSVAHMTFQAVKIKDVLK